MDGVPTCYWSGDGPALWPQEFGLRAGGVKGYACALRKGFTHQGRRCVKRKKTKRPCSSCRVEDTEQEAGNGFKEKRELLSCNEPQSFRSV